MKKFTAWLMAFMLVFSVCFVGCGDNKTIRGVEYGTYGIINKSEMCNPNISYELIVGNVVWSVLLVETIIAPIYFIGFSMYEPVGVKIHNEKGSVD